MLDLNRDAAQVEAARRRVVHAGLGGKVSIHPCFCCSRGNDPRTVTSACQLIPLGSTLLVIVGEAKDARSKNQIMFPVTPQLVIQEEEEARLGTLR